MQPPPVSLDVEPRIRRADCPIEMSERPFSDGGGLGGQFSVCGKFPAMNALSVIVRRRPFFLKSDAALGMTGF